MKKCKNILLYFVALITILIIIILLAVRFIFWRDDTDNSDTVINEVTVDYYDLEDKLELKDSSIYKTDIQQELEKYGNYSSSVLRFQNNLIYGNYLSKELMNIVMLTKGVWIYDVISKDFDYYEYPDGYRIRDFYVLNDYIYYIKLELDFESDLYMWEFIKSDLNFENKINIESGCVKSPVDFPKLEVDDVTGKVYVYFVSDDIRYNDDILVSNVGEFKICVLENDELIPLITNKYDYTNDTGVYLFNTANTFKVYNNELIYYEIINNNIGTVKVLDLLTDKTKIIYDDINVNDWNVSELFIGNDLYYLTLLSKDDKNNGKIISVLKDGSVINIVNSKGSKKSSILSNDYFVIASHNTFAIFSARDGSYKYKLGLDTNDYMENTLSDGDNTVIFKDRDGDYYVVTIN